MKIEIRLRLALTLLIALIVVATIFYNITEEWGLIDSLYFTVKTATTVGYGDIVPTKPVTRVFTIFFMILSTGLTLYSVGLLAQKRIMFHLELHHKRLEEKITKKNKPKKKK